MFNQTTVTQKKFISLFFCFLIFWSLALLSRASEWKEVSSGIEYLALSDKSPSPWSAIHAFRIDLKQHPLELVMAPNFQEKSAFVEDFLTWGQGLIGINGGFFDQQYKSLGLRVINGQQRSPIKPISWWGVFYIQANKPYLTTAKEYVFNRNMSFAVQSGPRLIVNNVIPSLKPGEANRSALGITKEGKLIILVTAFWPMTTTELANRLKVAPFNCNQALNLDGGSSSQLAAKIGDFKLSVSGFSKVSDAIIVR